MKTKFFTIVGVALLLAGSHAADAQQTQLQQTTRTRQRTGGTVQGGYSRVGYGTVNADPRTQAMWTNSPYGTNGFDIIAINNIFNQNRYYTIIRQAGPPPVPSYNFTVNGIMTYGPQDVGYVFFYGNSVNNNKGYTNSETINGFKISEITNNTVTLVDTNSKTFTLKVGSGFSKLGTNDWRYLPALDPSSYVPSATSSGDSGDNLDAAPPGPISDAMSRLRARRQAEMGGDPAGAAGPDANSTPDTNSIPLTPASTSGDNNP